MTCSSPRVTLSILLLGALAAAGCVSGGSTRTTHATGPMVTADDMERNPDQAIEKTLEAKVPGLLVTRNADGTVALQIRGAASFYGASTPLYVIDDVPIAPGSTGILTGINPYDIETIKVLKDPADTGIYGIRGANGVILITTKHAGHPKN